ncbi:MAG: glycosyltransferase [Candidatus Omnitrophica bacterium]|nr:glycosyltransferase [Candidatus Omnitrophota bacterium]
MKVIVVYASAGAGHLRSAEAIYAFLKENHPQIDVELIDVLDKTGGLFRFLYRQGYSLLVNHAVSLWQGAYQLTYFRPLRWLTRGIARLINRFNTREFARYLVGENHDFIISTHFLPSEISANLKNQKRINAKVITVITDFCVHPFWISAGTDIYITACEYTNVLLSQEGARQDIIRPFGIPVHPVFLKPYDKGALCVDLGIDDDKFTILISTGSFGIGPLEEVTKYLCQKAQLLVVCAGNKKLYQRLKEKDYPGVRVFGFVDNMQELMSVSDMIITKPGGLTIAELLIKELPPVFISAIPGQETGNAAVLESHGIGLVVNSAKELIKAVSDYKDNPDKLDAVRANIRKIRKPAALKELCDVLR